MCFEQGGVGALRYQGRLSVPMVDDWITLKKIHPWSVLSDLVRRDQFVEKLLEKLKSIGRRDIYISSNLEKFQIEVLILF